MTSYISSKPRYEILDGLRGVAAVMVLVYHICEPHWGQTTQPVAHGYLAVDFFFVLSGFVIGYAYNDRWSNGLSLKEFMKRRITRLRTRGQDSVLSANIFFLINLILCFCLFLSAVATVLTSLSSGASTSAVSSSILIDALAVDATHHDMIDSPA